MSTHPIEVMNALLPTVSDEQIKTIETEQSGLLTRAIDLVVNSTETEALAWEIVNGIGELKANIVEDFKESKEAAHKAHKAICNQEKGHLDKLIRPDEIVRGKLSVWAGEKKKLLEAEERRAREAAETERKRLQAIADEEARVEQERLRQEAEARKINEAVQAEASGMQEVAEAIMATPVIVPTVAPAPVIIATPVAAPSAYAQKVTGSGSMVENWYFTIDREDLIPREYLMVDEKAIQGVVDALKKNTKIAGISVSSKFEARRAARR